MRKVAKRSASIQGPDLKAMAIVRPPAAQNSLFVLRFAAWAARAQEAARADAASALARAYLHSALPAPRREEIATAMAALLDDPSTTVRRALSDALSGAHDPPRALVVALANDEADVSEPILLRSPLLTDAELADCATTADAAAECAIARRARLGPLAACALAQKAGPEAILILLGNPGAALPALALPHIHARDGEIPGLRDALLARPDLAATLKAEILLAGTEIARADSARAERAAREVRDASLVRIAAECDAAELPELTRALRARGVLTLALLMRSLLTGERALAGAALAELAGAPRASAAALSHVSTGEGFAALGSKAGVPRHGIVALQAAFSALAASERETGKRRDGCLRSDLVRRTIAACEARHDPALAPAIALLWRFAAEAVRRDARVAAGPAFGDSPRLPATLDFPPANDIGPLLLTADICAKPGDEAADAEAA